MTGPGEYLTQPEKAEPMGEHTAGVHPDLTAHRAVDACGGTYTLVQEASGYAAGHRAALDEACEAVKAADALTADLLEALKEAVEEVEDLRRNANNHGGMFDDETCDYGRAALTKAQGGEL